MQSSSAFGSIHDGLSFFRNVYDQFASYRASIIRLYGLVDANQRARDLPELTLELCPDDSVTLDEVEVRTPDGKQLIKPLDVRLESGDSMVITGPSGSGKTTLLRSLAQMWPYTSGTLRCPIEGNQTMFLSQLPYVPLGDLRAVVSYPCEEGTLADDALQRASGERGAAAPRHPAQRGAGLGQGALPRRAAADRVRAHPAHQAQGRVPRRGHLGARRGTGTDAVPAGSHANCPTPSWSASAIAAPSNSTTASNWNCSATANGGSARSASKPVPV